MHSSLRSTADPLHNNMASEFPILSGVAVVEAAVFGILASDPLALDVLALELLRSSF
jgi:hypothetical protein